MHIDKGSLIDKEGQEILNNIMANKFSYPIFNGAMEIQDEKEHFVMTKIANDLLEMKFAGFENEALIVLNGIGQIVKIQGEVVDNILIALRRADQHYNLYYANYCSIIFHKYGDFGWDLLLRVSEFADDVIEINKYYRERLIKHYTEFPNKYSIKQPIWGNLNNYQMLNDSMYSRHNTLEILEFIKQNFRYKGYAYTLHTELSINANYKLREIKGKSDNKSILEALKAIRSIKQGMYDSFFDLDEEPKYKDWSIKDVQDVEGMQIELLDNRLFIDYL